MSEHVHANREQRARVSDGHDIARRSTPDAPAASPFASVDLSRLPVRPEMFLVDDSVAAPGQMAKQEFLTQLRAHIIEAADQELAGTGWTAEGCPWLEYWLDYYARRTAGDGEAALRKFAPGIASAASASDYFEPIVARVRSAIRRWRETGTIEPPFGPMPRGDEVGPEAVRAQLGAGRPLAPDVRSRMERGFERDLSKVRVHTDAPAGRVAAEHDARAITVGSSIGLARTQYRPGTLEGDLLLAHEIAHTLQQTTSATEVPGSDPRQDEAGADRAASLAVARASGFSMAAPRVHGGRGLALRRCNNMPRDFDDAHALDDIRMGESKQQAWLRHFRRDYPQYEGVGAVTRMPRDDGIMTPSGIRVPAKPGDLLAPREAYERPLAYFFVYQGYIHYAELIEARQDSASLNLAESLYSRTGEQVPKDTELDLAAYVGWSYRAMNAREGAQVGLMAADIAMTTQDIAMNLSRPPATIPPVRPMPEPVTIPDELGGMKAADAAKRMNLPEAPEGYYWTRTANNQLVIARKPVRLPGAPKPPKLRYDPATREFAPESELVPPKPAVVRPGKPPPELEEAANQAVAARDAIPNPGKKTVARAADGTVRTSGWGSDVKSLDPVEDLSRKIGHQPEVNPARDAPGKPGSYNLSHAEKQGAVVTGGDEPIGVSREMCMDCQTSFQKLANYRGNPIVVADPSGVRVFLPDGRVLSAPNVSSLVWPPATSDDKDKQ